MKKKEKSTFSSDSTGSDMKPFAVCLSLPATWNTLKEAVVSPEYIQDFTNKTNPYALPNPQNGGSPEGSRVSLDYEQLA